MRTSDDGIFALALHEGIVPGPYRDSVGVWTYGIGHAETSGLPPNPARMPRGMPADLDAALADVFATFRRDLRRYEADVNRAVRVPVTQEQFDALVSFHYNTGAIGRASMVRKLNAGDMAGAAAGFMAWTRPREVIGRRKAEQALFATGAYPSGTVPVYGVTATGSVVRRPVRRLTKAQVMALMRPRASPETAARAMQAAGADPAATPATDLPAAVPGRNRPSAQEKDMDGYKGILASKAVWGGLIALLAGLAGLFGYTVTADDTATLVRHIDSLVAAAGGILAIWGRITATKRIG